MIMEHLVVWELAGETEVLGENLPQWHFVHNNLNWDGTRASVEGSRRLTAWAMTRPTNTLAVKMLEQNLVVTHPAARHKDGRTDRDWLPAFSRNVNWTCALSACPSASQDELCSMGLVHAKCPIWHVFWQRLQRNVLTLMTTNCNPPSVFQVSHDNNEGVSKIADNNNDYYYYYH
jgi:hypothetical protein